MTASTAAAAAVDNHRENDLVLLEIKINGELASPLSVICHRWVSGGWFLCLF